jgi:hypothetical protein
VTANFRNVCSTPASPVGDAGAAVEVEVGVAAVVAGVVPEVPGCGWHAVNIPTNVVQIRALYIFSSDAGSRILG